MLPNDKLGPLIKLSVSDFVGSVGARTTAPGGGSVAAMVGALGASLGSMVAKLSHGKRIFEQNEEPMRRLIPIFHEAMEDILNFVDADTDAFTDYVNARRLPKATPIEQAVREAAMEAGIKNAISVPLNLAKAIDKLWQPAQELAPLINIASASDLEVGVNCLKIGLLSAYYNVKINLKDTTDEKYKLQIDEEVERLREQSNHQCQAVLDILEKRKQPTELGPQNDLK
ncbi:Formimidoyltransferase-cyclodeaminase [Halotydeus destructor]|nr:Formimidoyltransferase-cyclodeaminase [Halotydeus destructor]